MQKTNGQILLSPSDLNDYVECEHRISLALEVARGDREKPHVADQGAELLRQKGDQHEREYLARLRADGRSVVEIPPADFWNFEAAAAHTAEAMRAGAEVIWQATF